MYIVDEYLDRLTIEVILVGVDGLHLELTPKTKAYINKSIKWTYISNKERARKKCSQSPTETPQPVPPKPDENIRTDTRGNTRFYYDDCLVQCFPNQKDRTFKVMVSGLSPRPQSGPRNYASYQDHVLATAIEVIGILNLKYSEREVRWRNHEWKMLVPLPSYLELSNLTNLLHQGDGVKYYCRNRIHVVPRQGIHNKLTDVTSRYVSMTDLSNKLVAWAYTPRRWRSEDDSHRGFYIKGFYEDQETGEKYRISLEHNGTSLVAIDDDLKSMGVETDETLQIEIERYYKRDEPCYFDDRRILYEMLDQCLVEGGVNMEVDNQLKVVQSAHSTMLATLMGSRDNSVEKMHHDVVGRLDGLQETVESTHGTAKAIRRVTDIAHKVTEDSLERFVWFLRSRGGKADARAIGELFRDQRGSNNSLRDLVSSLARELETRGKIINIKGAGSRPSMFMIREADGTTEGDIQGHMLAKLAGLEASGVERASAAEFFAECSQDLGVEFELCRRVFVERVHANPDHPFILVGKEITFLSRDDWSGDDFDEGGPENPADKVQAQAVRGTSTTEPCSATPKGDVGSEGSKTARMAKADKAEVLSRLVAIKRYGRNPESIMTKLQELAEGRPLADMAEYREIASTFEDYQHSDDIEGNGPDDDITLYQMKIELDRLIKELK